MKTSTNRAPSISTAIRTPRPTQTFKPSIAPPLAPLAKKPRKASLHQPVLTKYPISTQQHSRGGSFVGDTNTNNILKAKRPRLGTL